MINILRAVLHPSVTSKTVTPWTEEPGRLQSMGILQARIMEWVAIPSFRGSSGFRDHTQASGIAGGFFSIRATRET